MRTKDRIFTSIQSTIFNFIYDIILTSIMHERMLFHYLLFFTTVDCLDKLITHYLAIKKFRKF